MRIDLSIFDQVFVLDCTPDKADSLKANARTLDLQLRAAKANSPRLSPERLAILTALGLVQDKQQLSEQLAQLQQQPLDDIPMLSSKLDTLTSQAQQLLQDCPAIAPIHIGETNI